jgi:2-polyprenyl-6-methoxyphenol hydroxylase-like FAD-dependent oxidoreductase
VDGRLINLDEARDAPRGQNTERRTSEENIMARSRQAIVIGASMGGLLAARALSDHFDRVTILERDATPDSREHRKGVPHGRSTHGLLAHGSRTLETLFPGFRDDILAEGAIDGDIVGGSIWHISGVTLKSAPSDLRGYLVSRPTLENAVRRRVRRLANVEIVERCDVKGLAISSDRRRVTGVLARAAGSGDEPQFAPGDLVVDASGRAQRASAGSARSAIVRRRRTGSRSERPP